MMARFLTMALLLAFPVFIVGLPPVLWYRAEKKGELRKPVLTGILAFALSLALAWLSGAVFTELDDQSYYAASVRTLLDETQAALDSGEPGFADRLRAFRASQRLTYESRAGLLENARRFAEEGAAIRAARQARPEAKAPMEKGAGE